MGEENNVAPSENRAGRPAEVCLETVIEHTAELLAQRWKKSRIKQELSEILGTEISARSFERIMAGARAMILESAKQPKSEHLALSVEFYKKILADEEASIHVKIRAQENLEKLLGIGGSFRSADTPDETARAIRKAQEAMDEAAKDASA